MILYHKSNLVYIVVFPQFLSFQQNNSAETLMLIFFKSRHYSFFEKLKIVEKKLCFRINYLNHRVRRNFILYFHNKFQSVFYLLPKFEQNRTVRSEIMNF